MDRAEWKRGSKPDSTRTFGHGRIEFLTIGGGVVRRFTLEPGWRWSQDMGPVAGTEWCEASHFQYQISGHLHVLLSDGTEFEVHAGDLAILPPGHDTWVVGAEPVVLVDWYRASNLAVPAGGVAPDTSDEFLPKSERWFHALLDNSLDLITVVSAEGKITYASPSLERVLGWKPADLTGRSIFEWIHPEDSEELKAAFQRASTNRPSEERFVELRFRAPDGNYRRLEVIGRNSLSDPAVRGIVVSARDVTEKREAQEQLRRSEEGLRDLIANMPVLLWALSTDLVPLAWNKECERVTGWAADEILRNRHAIERLLPDPSDRAALERRLRDVGSDSRNFEMSVTCHDGSVRTIAWSSLAGRYPVPGWAMWAVGRDVTAEKQATRALMEASRLAATSQLAEGLARSIDALMATVGGNASLLRASTKDLDARESLAKMMKAAEDASGLTRELMAYGRGRPSQTLPMSANEIVSDIVDSQQDALLRREISVELDLGPEGAKIWGDPAQIRQLVDGLLTNAVQAISGAGKIVIQTRAVTASDSGASLDPAPGGHLQISIRDTGCGMDAKTLSRAFEPFFSTKRGGSGLGLSAARAIVQAQHGTISAQSRPGEGSTFTVRLPTERKEGS